jgi:hypothetical protein
LKSSISLFVTPRQPRKGKSRARCHPLSIGRIAEAKVMRGSAPVVATGISRQKINWSSRNAACQQRCEAL